ncbi:hypothetical protein MMC19_003880 [Ptychographa xylographoides]|nr:hypothetical protein [Ptychographa xylographoides]
MGNSLDSTPPYAPPLTHPRSAPRLPDTDTASLRTLPPYSASRWGNYGSEAEYLAALRAWVEDKQYVAPAEGKNGLTGFYGTKSMDYYASRPGLGSARKERRASEALLAQHTSAGEGQQQGGEPEGRRRRKSSLGNWLSRKRTGEASTT